MLEIAQLIAAAYAMDVADDCPQLVRRFDAERPPGAPATHWARVVHLADLAGLPREWALN